MSDDFKVDIDKAVREAEKTDRLAEIESNLRRMTDETEQRNNRRAAVELGLIDAHQAHLIALEKDKENDKVQQTNKALIKQKLRGLVRDRDGYYRDFNGNRFNSVGTKIEDDGEWQ